jgi:hypothetical protein
MGLSPMALDVVMSLIAISIPALLLVGCIITRKRAETPKLNDVAPQFELDRAA